MRKRIKTLATKFGSIRSTLILLILAIIWITSGKGKVHASGETTALFALASAANARIAMVEPADLKSKLFALTLTAEAATRTALPPATDTPVPTAPVTDTPGGQGFTDTPTSVPPLPPPTSAPASTFTPKSPANTSTPEHRIVVTPIPWGTPVAITPRPEPPTPVTFTPTPSWFTPPPTASPTAPTPSTFTPTPVGTNNVSPAVASPTSATAITFTPTPAEHAPNTIVAPPPAPPTQPAEATFTPAASTASTQGACSGQFIPHDLPHITTIETAAIRPFAANGAGVAVNDLDNDGLLDIVLGGNEGADTILWNEGKLTFQWSAFGTGRTRAVNIVDVDGDGWQDIVLTKQSGAIEYWRNLGKTITTRSGQRFALTPLPGVTHPAYAMDWADFTGDGALDLVTGSYTTSVAAGSTGAGVYAYANQDLTFTPTRLATDTLALAVGLLDVNADGQLDVLVGNDSALPDQTWLHQGQQWLPAAPFARTSYSTRSFAWGDVNNDGVYDLFVTDMKPYTNDPATLAVWQPILAALEEPQAANDPQLLGNALQMRSGAQAYANRAVAWGVDATGWSWSGQFGDFDNDGYLDLYVVNGMIDQTAFAALPNRELVEENQAFHNQGGARFAPAPEWNLASTRSGRGMVIADFDNDGDLDIVVNNLGSPAQLFENQLCRGASLEVDLHWPQSHNPHGIGARLVLHTSAGIYYRDVRVASGYLSSNPARVHFGFPTGVQPQQLDVHWPDGVITRVDKPQSNTLITVEH